MQQQQQTTTDWPSEAPEATATAQIASASSTVSSHGTTLDVTHLNIVPYMSTDVRAREGKNGSKNVKSKVGHITAKTAIPMTGPTVAKTTGPMTGPITAKTTEPNYNYDARSNFSAKNVNSNSGNTTSRASESEDGGRPKNQTKLKADDRVIITAKEGESVTKVKEEKLHVGNGNKSRLIPKLQ